MRSGDGPCRWVVVLRSRGAQRPPLWTAEGRAPWTATGDGRGRADHRAPPAHSRGRCSHRPAGEAGGHGRRARPAVFGPPVRERGPPWRPGNWARGPSFQRAARPTGVTGPARWGLLRRVARAVPSSARTLPPAVPLPRSLTAHAERTTDHGPRNTSSSRRGHRSGRLPLGEPAEIRDLGQRQHRRPVGLSSPPLSRERYEVIHGLAEPRVATPVR